MDVVSVDQRMSSGAATLTSRGATLVMGCREASMTQTSVDVAVKLSFVNVFIRNNQLVANGDYCVA